ncbi:MAG: methyltransferase [Daejeonella sp.]
MVSLFLRNLLFTILQPGIIAGLIPFWIVHDQVLNFLKRPLGFYDYLGIVVSIIGVIILSLCILSFALLGRGTLSPADPTKNLVVKGLYQYSRNPMYVGVTMMLLGEVIMFQSVSLIIYSFSIFTAFNIFIILFEEPRLKKDFGEEYNKYYKKVRRWM